MPEQIALCEPLVGVPKPLSYLSAGKESKQDVSTPPDLVEYVRRRWGIHLDLAATAGNHVCEYEDNFIGPDQDSLTLDWACLLHAQDCTGRHWPRQVGWLNPPFGKLAPWMTKCALEASRGAHIIALVPNTQEAAWFWDYVLQPDDRGIPHGPCTVYPLKARLAFPGYLDKRGRPQVAGQGHMLIDFHGGAWGGIHPLNWKDELERMREARA